MIEIPLSDADWTRVKHLFVTPEPVVSRGRPRRDARPLLDAILWVHLHREKWHRLPTHFPPQQTCYAKYIAWRREGILQRVAGILEIEPFDS
ncbi:transposase [Paraburkholderia flava]|uniref:transposase n=1 Tax=Paraburkholderia flava TaxID=2547393 RepID=UPI00105B6434|nr:transposase [Paraburkholderia flava]